MSTIPPPPPPGLPRRPISPAVYALGGVIVALLVALIVVVLTRGGGQTEPTSTTTAAPTDPATGSTAAPFATPDSSSPPSSDPGVIANLFDLQSGDIVVAGQDGIGVFGPLEVAFVSTEPTQVAMPTPDGSILHYGPYAPDYPDFWPPTIPSGDNTLWMLHPDGTDEALYTGGAQLRLFEVAVIPEVAPGPSAVLLQSDLLDDFPFRSDSLVIVPLDGSAPHVVPDVSGYESIVTGAAWMDGFFAVSLSAEGFDAFDAYDLTGARVEWVANPEPGATRDFDVHVSALTRIGTTSRIAYTRSPDYSFQAPVDLVIFDTATATEVASVPILIAGYDASMISASNELIAISVMRDVGAGDWPFAQATIGVVDTTAFIADGLDRIGTATVVP